MCGAPGGGWTFGLGSVVILVAACHLQVLFSLNFGKCWHKVPLETAMTLENIRCVSFMAACVCGMCRGGQAIVQRFVPLNTCHWICLHCAAHFSVQPLPADSCCLQFRLEKRQQPQLPHAAAPLLPAALSLMASARRCCCMARLVTRTRIPSKRKRASRPPAWSCACNGRAL